MVSKERLHVNTILVNQYMYNDSQPLNIALACVMYTN